MHYFTTWYVDRAYIDILFAYAGTAREMQPRRAITRNKHIVCKSKIIRSFVANANGAQRNERLQNRCTTTDITTIDVMLNDRLIITLSV